MTTPRHFGWKPSLPDHRDIYYTAPRSLFAALPERVDLTENWDNPTWSPVWDQSSLGSCGPHSVCADIVFAALRQQKRPTCPMPSRLFVYYVTRLLMGTVNQDSGVDNRTMLKALAQYGWCDESMWPYDINRYRVQPSQACFQQAQTRKISQYLAVRQDLNEMKSCLAGGDTIIVGFSVYQSIDKAESNGYIPYPQRSERQVGGHDILICGYNDKTQRFKLRNSWNGWGLGGYGEIDYQYLLNPNLAGDYWTVIHSALPDIPPEPVPPIPPTPIPPTPVPPNKGKIIIDVDWTNHKAEISSVI